MDGASWQQTTRQKWESDYEIGIKEDENDIDEIFE